MRALPEELPTKTSVAPSHEEPLSFDEDEKGEAHCKEPPNLEGFHDVAERPAGQEEDNDNRTGQPHRGWRSCRWTTGFSSHPRTGDRRRIAESRQRGSGRGAARRDFLLLGPSLDEYTRRA
jgi:hypothetical protein